MNQPGVHSGVFSWETHFGVVLEEHQKEHDGFRYHAACSVFTVGPIQPDRVRWSLYEELELQKDGRNMP